jgi:hypothetical protein
MWTDGVMQAQSTSYHTYRGLAGQTMGHIYENVTKSLHHFYGAFTTFLPPSVILPSSTAGDTWQAQTRSHTLGMNNEAV